MLLNLASSWSVFFLDLDGPEQILPDIFDVSGVSEGQNGVVFINRDDSSDGLNILLDNTTADWLVGLIASNAGPGHWVLLSAGFEGIEKGDLLLVGEGGGLDGKECQHKEEC